jgi:hypothetical protein
MLNKIVAVAVSFLCFATADVFAAPIGAKAVHVEGDARLLSARTAKESRISVGFPVEEGDRIKTARNGIVEVEFDNGDLIRVDVDSDMTIRSLHRDDNGSTFSIFSLVIGRVKSAVSKLTTAESKFEYHTKAAICGVGGTPPFVVEFRNEKVNVDLLGKPGDKGFVYVQGFDPAKTMVSLLAGTHTTARFGQAPAQSSPIPADRLQKLNRTIPFSSKLKEADKVSDSGKEPAKPAPAAGERLVSTTLTNNLSVPRQVGAANAQTLTGANAQTSSRQGAVGTGTQPVGGSNAPPPIATFNINIRFR